MKDLRIDCIRGHMGGNRRALFPEELFTQGEEPDETVIVFD